MEIVEHDASRAQRRLWFVEQLAPGEPLHNIAFRIDFAARLEPDALRRAVDDLVDRHESLRTRLVRRAGTLRQVVLDHLDRPVLQVVDCVDDAEADRHAARAARQAFDLESPPLLRVLQVRRPAPAPDRLVVVMHHAVSDAWSVGVLFNDLTHAYRARLEHRAPDWSPLPVQYVDFTAWQEQQADSAQAREDLAYWAEQLADLPTLDLTQGRPRPTDAGHRGGSIPVAILGADGGRLAEFAAAERCTPFMVLLAGYVAALGRVFGTTDVVVGTSVAGRPLPELATMIGLFVDRQVLRVGLAGATSFRDLVHRAREVVVSATEHGSVTFDQIVEHLAPQREYGVTPLAQASINLTPAFAHTSLVRGSDSDRATMPLSGGARLDTDTVQHDLALDLLDTPSGYQGNLSFRHGVVRPEAARRVADMLVRVLRAGLSDPDRPAWTVPLLDDAEVAEVRAVRDGGPAAGSPRPLVTALDEWADRTPDAVAVRDEHDTLTYAELRARVDDLAHRLRGMGVTAETPVVVALPRCAALVVAMYAVQRAGGAYVSVDPAAPAGHLAEIAAGLYPHGGGLAVVGVGADAALPTAVRRHQFDVTGPVPTDLGPPDATPRPEQAAYVLFTSGSTGAPKGVVVEHRNLAHYTHAVLTRLTPPPGARYLMVQAPTFDSAGTMIYGALATGGELDLVTSGTAADPGALAAHLARYPADYLKITPSHLSALLGAGDPDPLRPRRALVLGGESADRELTDRLRAAGWSILAHYGPTETTIGVLADWLTDELAVDVPTVPLGRPLPGVTARVLDAWGQPVPVGSIGELHISGALVTRGYLGAPGLTAAMFHPDPDAAPGTRAYRTGDLVRPLPDGAYEFLGRADRQIKVNGFRVEPAAVERSLCRHPDVRAAAVLTRRVAGSDRLVGYVAVPDPGPADLAAIRATATTTLPAYAVPAHLVALAELPTTRHGKLDTAALPAPAEPAAVGSTAPADTTERELLAVWRDVLQRHDLGVTDDFFAVGGDSIQVINVVGEARRRGLPVASRDLFAAPTVRGLAARLAAGSGSAGSDVADTPAGSKRPDTPFPDTEVDDDELAHVLASLDIEGSP